MENSTRRTPIKLMTLQEARENLRSKSSLGSQNTDLLSQYSTEKSITSSRHCARVSDCAKKIHRKSIENNKNLIEKAFAVKEAFASPVKEKKESSVSSVRKQVKGKTTARPGFLQNLLISQERQNKFESKEKTPNRDVCKNEVICFIKGLEKIRYKLLKS